VVEELRQARHKLEALEARGAPLSAAAGAELATLASALAAKCQEAAGLEAQLGALGEEWGRASPFVRMGV